MRPIIKKTVDCDVLTTVIIFPVEEWTFGYQENHHNSFTHHSSSIKKPPSTLSLSHRDMGKICCGPEPEEDGINFMGLLLAFVIALVLLLICLSPPRRRKVVTIYPKRC
ncbi:hypothetical protein COCNU_04G009290 [Cocos nucifera]|uniref:Uncharacterized protein n=1 Tax=Cocos nucifera TaxID=13894 RepID=A0A8K0I7A8_COCNU|nr:hypothetical protein COCNU_04G009290 [Cocos nucifera]